MRSIIDRYPISKAEFFGHMLNTYGVTEDGSSPCFYDAPEFEQHKAIARFFGYPIGHQEFTDVMILRGQTERYMKDYHEIAMKYPDGVPDLLKQLKDMGHAEIAALMPEVFVRSANLLPSLCHALVSATGKDYHIKMPVFKSLKDALVEAKIIIPAVETVQTIIEPTIIEETIIDFTKIEDDAPF